MYLQLKSMLITSEFENKMYKHELYFIIVLLRGNSINVWGGALVAKRKTIPHTCMMPHRPKCFDKKLCLKVLCI